MKITNNKQEIGELKRMGEQNRAITLTALVITIVVLIILAGVTINAILGENGIITIAKQAKENIQLAQEKEQTESNELYMQMAAEEGSIGSEGGNEGELEETIKQLEATVADLNKQLEQERANKTELENTITDLNGQVENLNQQIVAGNTTIEEQQGTIDNLNSEINTKNEELANKNQTIEQLEGSVSTLNTQVASLNSQITELKKKQATGNAVASDVLSGKTFSNSSGIGLTGSMANRGALNWNPSSSTTYTVQPGYYSGGTLNSSGAYNAGKTSKTSQVKTGTFTIPSSTGTATVQTINVGFKPNVFMAMVQGNTKMAFAWSSLASINVYSSNNNYGLYDCIEATDTGVKITGEMSYGESRTFTYFAANIVT